MDHQRLRVPSYLFRGRVRTSTLALLAVFIGLFVVQQNYEPPEKPPPPAQVVPPGFVPDPDYTWVPRTNVQTRAPETTTTAPTTTTTTTTTTPTPTPTTTPPSTDPGAPLLPGFPPEATTTVIDPDGRGPLGPQTFVAPPPDAPAPPTIPPVVPPPPATP
ncbi:hypothetical protein ACAG25_14450 [Mycobacterium sp. pV006]|uniref:hypothetical protein n=1 Tax=Mycobacterium sp. pV006 TaxID=3238983 RepID=UPI00351B8618